MNALEQQLNGIRKTVQMGESGILSTIGYAKDDRFRMALQQQLAEYHHISNTADTLLRQVGAQAQDVSPMAKTCAAAWARTRLRCDGSDSKLAEMMITGSTKGIIKGLRQLHRHGGQNSELDQLSEKLISTEQDNITQMKQYL